jgi:excisionase family DNA binding protein
MRTKGPNKSARRGKSADRSLRCGRCDEWRDPRALETLGEVARRLGTSERHVRRLVDERRIPFVKVGRFVRFDSHDVEHWIDDQRFDPSELRHGRPSASVR